MNVDKYKKVINDSIDAQKKWRTVPAPVRGELIRKFGNNLRENLVSLGVLNASIIVIPPIPDAVAKRPLTKPILGFEFIFVNDILGLS